MTQKRPEKNNFCIYVLSFPNGKKYIGQTCQNPNRRWRNGSGYIECPAVNNAINKYGWENVKHEVIAEHLSHQQANQIEIALIAYHKTTDKRYGYNIQKGGTSGRDGLKNTEEQNRKIAESKKKPVYGFDKDTKKLVFFFNSISEAAEKTGATRQEIGKCCNRKAYSSGGYIWRHSKNEPLDDYDHGSGRIKAVRMLDKHTGQVIDQFQSVSEAEKRTGIFHQHISKCAGGKRKSAGGYAWQYC